MKILLNMTNLIIEKSLDEFFENISKKMCLKKDELNSYYNSFKYKHTLCNINDCKNEIINKEIYCEFHYNDKMRKSIKDVNQNITNLNIIKKENDIYEDIFNLKYKIVNNELIRIN